MKTQKPVSVELDNSTRIDWLSTTRGASHRKGSFVATERALFSAAAKIAGTTVEALLRAGGRQHAIKLVASSLAPGATPATRSRVGARDSDFLIAYRQKKREGARVTPTSLAYRVNKNAKAAKRDVAAVTDRTAARWMTRLGIDSD